MNSSFMLSSFAKTSVNRIEKKHIFHVIPLSAALIVLQILPGPSMQAQEKPPQPEKTLLLPQNPEESVTTYLDTQVAHRENDALKAQIKRDILLLFRLSKNFGREIQGSDQIYAQIRELYKKGMEHYYKGEAILANRNLEQARAISLELYKKYSENYDKQVSTLLSSCSESMVNREMESSLDPENGVISDALLENHYKLKIAYGQAATAEALIRANRYDTAIDHYRIAKIYAIRVLKDLELDPGKRTALDEKYKLDLLDAVGGMEGGTPSTSGGDKTQ